MKIKTVVVDTENGPVTINESDYDAEKHTLSDEQAFDDGGKKAAGENADAVRQTLLEQARELGLKPNANTGIEKLTAMIDDATKPDAAMMVMAKDGKHFVTDDKGAAIVAEGIDAAGYATDKDAWAAILAANQA